MVSNSKGTRRMGPLLCLADPTDCLVADASAVINLNATGRAAEILAALKHRVAIVNAVVTELEAGERGGRHDHRLLNELAAVGLVEIVQLNAAAAHHFETLVVGNAATTLDDGEAATIAYAIEVTGIAIIDERKATRICRHRFPALRLGSTVDMLADGRVRRALGRTLLSHAVLNALHRARMRVLPHHVAWIVDLIGPEEAARCPSLPRSVRGASEDAQKSKT